MSENICSICNENFEDKYFDKEQNKCILHSEKSIRSRAFNDDFFYLLEKYTDTLIDSTGKLFLKNIVFPNFNPDDEGDFSRLMKKYKKIEFFQCAFYNQFSGFRGLECCFYMCEFYNDFVVDDIRNLDETFLFILSTFHKNVNFYEKVIFANLFRSCQFKTSINFSNVEFKKLVFSDIVNQKFDELIIENSIFNERFLLDKGVVINKLILNETIFEDKVKIQFSNIKEASFYNTSFRDLADFYQTKFKKVDFTRTDFEKISVFSECEFNCNVDFKYTKFLGKAIFRDTVIKGKLNLRETIFDDEANFLDISAHSRKNKNGDFIGDTSDVKVENRETARIIKNFFDTQNNTIEANKFYRLEMEERTKEYFNMNKNDNHLFEMIIFICHKLSSNHSQSWSLSVFWIVIFTLLYSAFMLDDSAIIELSTEYKRYNYIFLEIYKEYGGYLHLFSLCIFIYVAWTVIEKKWHKSALFFFLFIVSFPIYFYYTSDYALYNFTNLLNPFSIMNGDEKLTLGLLLYKIIIAYLIYQLIVSIRQNTRRK